MVRKDGAAVRKERMQEIARTVQRNLQQYNGVLPLSKTVAAFAYDLGLTKATVMEYLKILEELGQFVINIESDKIQRVEET